MHLGAQQAQSAMAIGQTVTSRVLTSYDKDCTSAATASTSAATADRVSTRTVSSDSGSSAADNPCMATELCEPGDAFSAGAASAASAATGRPDLRLQCISTTQT